MNRGKTTRRLSVARSTMVAYAALTVALSGTAAAATLGVATPASAGSSARPWPCRGPITVAGHPGATWGLSHAEAVWNAVRAGQPRLTGGRGAVVVQVVHKPGASWVGLTTWRDACHATVQLNAGTAQGYGNHTVPLRRWTTVHELGHVLGLPHTQERAVMNPHASLWMHGGRTYSADVHNLRRAYQ
jgi:hypothetical protein